MCLSLRSFFLEQIRYLQSLLCKKLKQEEPWGPALTEISSNIHIKHCPTKAVDCCHNSILWAQTFNPWQHTDFALLTVDSEKLSSILYSKRIATAVWLNDDLTEPLQNQMLEYIKIQMLRVFSQTTVFQTKMVIQRHHKKTSNLAYMLIPSISRK